jgi:hypothetical protein
MESTPLKYSKEPEATPILPRKASTKSKAKYLHQFITQPTRPPNTILMSFIHHRRRRLPRSLRPHRRLRLDWKPEGFVVS